MGLDKNTLEPVPKEKPIKSKCPGIYCDCSGDNIFYEENDEAFSLFMVPSKENDPNNYFIQRKSILLDIIEREKTLESIKSVTDKKCTE